MLHEDSNAVARSELDGVLSLVLGWLILLLTGLCALMTLDGLVCAISSGIVFFIISGMVRCVQCVEWCVNDMDWISQNVCDVSCCWTCQVKTGDCEVS